MNILELTDNLTNPALMFFLLGIIAVQLKSDLKIPESSSKFITLYLLLSIGFKGGQELAHSALSSEIIWSLILGGFLASAIPVLAFFLIKRRTGISNAAAIAASYGSVSAVTFVTAISFLETEEVFFDGHMIAVMAIMEAPAIIIGVLLMKRFGDSERVEGDEKPATLGHDISQHYQWKRSNAFRKPDDWFAGQRISSGGNKTIHDGFV